MASPAAGDRRSNREPVSGRVRQAIPDLKAMVRRTLADRWLTAGIAALAIAMALVVVAPATLLSVPLGFLAVAGLSRERRLGVLGAAALAVIAVPHGRAADSDLAMLAGLPWRFHDGVIAAAVVLALPRLRRPTLRPTAVRLSLLWLAIGAGALALGLAEGYPVRDIVRDLRWWLLYGFLAVAFWTATRRDTLLRAVLTGATLYAVLLVVTAVLPPFDGGLKSHALAYDAGLLRLQFNNGAFVLFAAAWLVSGLVRQPSLRTGIWCALLISAVLLSVTRVSVLVLAGVVVLTIAANIGRGLLGKGTAPTIRRIPAMGALAVVIGATAVGGLLLVGSPGMSSAVNPIQRILFLDPSAQVDAILRGRGATYVSAWERIVERPMVGHGLGALIEIGFSAGGSRPATPGMQPGVDNAYLTVATKAGVIGAYALTILFGWPLVEAIRRRRDRHRGQFALAWLAVLGLTVSQSFATVGYGPFVVAFLMAFMALRPVPSGRRFSARYAAASPVSSGA